MASKNVIIKRKIANEIFELLPKTSGAQVEVTWGSTVQDLATTLATVYTDLEAWNTFKKDVDFAGTDSALDTLRELIDMISDEEVATSIAGQLAEIKDRLTAVEAAAAKNAEDIAANASAITALQTTVAENKTAAEEAVAAVDAKAVKNAEDIAANKTAAEEAVAAVDAKAVKNAEDIAALQTTVAANKTTAEEAVAAVDAKAVKNAEDIAALQATAAAQARVIVSETVPDDLSEADLMMQIV